MAKFKFKKVGKLEEVPEGYRGLYVEKDGGFVVDAAKLEDFEWDDKEELSGALDREREDRKAAKAALEKYKDIDPERAREALDKLQKLEEKKLMDKGEFDRLLAKRKEEFDTAEAALKTQLAERDGRLDTYELINPIRDAALKAGVLPEDIEDVLQITKHRFKLDDKRKPVVLDKDGDPSSTLTVEKFFGEDFKTQKPKFYGATGAGGSGAPNGGSGGGTGGAKTVKRADFDKMGDTERAKFITEGGVPVD